jgi:outer membrane protein OmpA-like peptidoglycan-associated protein
MKRILLIVLAGCLFTGLRAQNTEEVKYSPSGGLLGAVNFSQFRTDKNANINVDYNSKAGATFGGWLNFPFSKGFSLEPELVYNSYHYQTSDTASGLLVYNGKAGYLTVPILLKFNLGDHFAITAGPQIDFRLSASDKQSAAQKSDFKGTSFTLNGGLELFPRGKVAIFARYLLGLSNMDDRTGHVATMDYKNSSIQLGLKLRLFGGTKTVTSYKATTVVAPLDTDGDGINDDVDKCPTVPGVAKYNGCPIPDTDKDGINDEEDKCPNTPGLAKYNGCPIPDTDNDGINDEEDKCPTVPGVAKYNGCPVPDRDNDGINDDNDKCPDIPGTAANNGCPDVPANVSKSVGLAAQGISFAPGTTVKLTNTSHASLDKVVTIMNENPGLHVRVEGHTDNTGNADDKMTLSQNRGNAVKDYLVSKGIAEDRITVEGFGGTQPISDNSTSSGRKKNNRIEIRMEY